jgi:hypothetical protein
MKWNNCRATRREIDEAGFRQQPDDKVLAHLTGCPSCRQFRDQRVLLRELTSSLPAVVAPADFDMRLRARLASQAATSPSGFWLSNPRFGTPAVAFAAAIVVLVGALVLLNQLGFIGSRATPPSRIAQGPREIAPPTTPPSIQTLRDDRNGGDGKKNGAIAPQHNPGPIKRASGPSTMIATSRSANPRSGSVNDPSPPTADLEERGARIIKQSEISLSTTPLSVSLQDSHGVTRKVSLPPVSFGGQVGAKSTVVTNRVW